MAEKTEIGELQVLITAQADKFNSEIARVQRQVSAFGNSVGKSTSGIGAMAVAGGALLASAFSKAFSAIVAQADAAITRLDTLNNFPLVMSNLGIGSEVAQQAINKLSDSLSGLPTSLSDAALAVQRFTSANGNIQASTDMYLALNDAILAGGASADIQATAMEQLAQAYAKGKPDMQEWRSMLIAMPAQLNQVASAMGYVSSNDLGEALREGTVSMNEFMRTVMKLDSEGVNGFASFAEQARNSTGGVQTSITNLKIAIQRGIANIMGVIGQVNIAGFFNKVASVIGTVSNYIAAFVKIVKEAIAWVSALFGGKGQTNQLVKETSSAGSNLGAAADSAGDMADNLGSAGKAAKKLNGQLAAFDEMNVLKEQDTSSGGGGGSGGSGGAGGGAGGFGDYAWDNDYTSDAEDKIKALADKIKQWFQDAFNLDWNTIGAAFVRFWGDIKAAAEPVGAVIKDIWNDYIRPLVTWAGNSLLPAVLNAIGGGIRFIAEVIGAAWSTFLKPFIDAFLVPIAQWTGGVIVDVLNAIGDGLRAMSENKDVCTVVAGGLIAIGTAIVGVKISGLIADFMQATSVFREAYKAGLSVSTAFGALASESTGLLGKISTIISYFGKANAAVSNFLRQGIDKLSTGFKNVVNAVKNPLKSIDNFKDKLSNLAGEGIQGFVNKVGSLKASLENVKDGFQKIVTHGGETTNWMMGTAKSAVDGIKAGFSGLGNVLNNLWQTFLANPLGIIVGLFSVLMATNEEFRAQMMTLIEQVMTPIANIMSQLMTLLQPIIDILVNLIEIALTPIMTILQALSPVIEVLMNIAFIPLKAVLEAIGFVIENVVKPALDAISGAFQWLADLLGINTQKVQENKDALTEEQQQMDLNKNGVLEYEEVLTALNDTIMAQNDAEMALMKAQEDQRKKMEEAKWATEQYGLSVDELIQLHREGKLSTLAQGDELKRLTETVIGVDNANIKVEAATQKLTEAQGEAQSQANQLKEQYDSAGSKLVELAETTGTGTDEFNKQKDKLNELKEAIRQTGKNVGEMTDWESKAYSAGANFGQGAINGINSQIGAVYNAGWNQAESGLKGFNDRLRIQSPSRVLMESGKYFSEGAAIGITENSDLLSKAAANLAAAANDTFTDNFDPISSRLKLNAKMELEDEDTIAGSINAKVAPHVTVKVGEDTLLDKIVDGINQASFMSNRAVINV